MEQQQMHLKAALKMAEALQKEAQRITEQPPPFRPEKVIGGGEQLNVMVQWLKDKLGINLPFAPLPSDPDPFTLSFAATHLVSALRVLAGEEPAEEPKGEEREPIIRIRDQKSPVAFSEVVITSTKELAELLRTELPEWTKQIITKATGKAKKEEEVCVCVKEEGEEQKEAVTVRLPGKLSERLERFEELLEEATDELEEVEEELAEAAEEGELTKERRAELEAKRQQIIQRIREATKGLEQTLGK